MVSTFIQAIHDKGIALVTRRNARRRSQGGQGTAPPATGVITTIWDKGFGFIGRDTPNERTDLYFHRTAVDGDDFDGLREGQHVTFEEGPNPCDRHHQRAVNVRPVAGGGRRLAIGLGAGSVAETRSPQGPR